MITVSNKELAAIYRQAAEDIFIRNQYSCCAIWNLAKPITGIDDAVVNSKVTRTDEYSNLFKQEGEMHNVFWINEKTDILPEELQEFRVMALLFMAAIIESGDL